MYILSFTLIEEKYQGNFNTRNDTIDIFLRVEIKLTTIPLSHILVALHHDSLFMYGILLIFSSVTNIEETLKGVLVQDLISKHPSFGQIKIDTSSIVIKRDLQHTYHSEQFVKEAMNESMAINNQKILPSNTKDKTLQSRIGVVRKTTVKPNPESRNDPDEPDIDTENIPVVQGSFQITKTEADITENKHATQSRHEDKLNHKPVSTSKTTTTTKAPTTKSIPTRNTTVKRLSSTTPKNRPFTIKSAFNIKPKIDSISNRDKDLNIHESSHVLPTTAKTGPNTKTTTTTTSTTSIPTTTKNVSQILFDLLTNENHDKDLPKIDTLFTVPHVIDNEPWRPITRPYYEVTSEQSTVLNKDIVDHEAKDRIGIAEVIEDVGLLESMLNPEPTKKLIEKTTRIPSGLYNIDPQLAADVYIPSPVYTSFTLPAFSPPLKDMETLGSSFPKPHPLPVDKISGVVEVVNENTPINDYNDGKPVERPPKDKTTSVAINVVQFDQSDNNTEEVSIEGSSIVKKQNLTTTNKIISTSTRTSTVTEQAKTSTSPNIDIAAEISTKKPLENKTNNTKADNTTKRPNNKVSIIPPTSLPHYTWELVNTSTNTNETQIKLSPQKYYNDTLQAIITKNEGMSPSTTPKFPNKISILRNLTDLIKRYSQNTSNKPIEISTPHPVEEPKSDFVNIEGEENEDRSEMGSVEVVLDEELETTTARVITLMPAKSNLGINRPLRPRPKIEAQAPKENKRSFIDDTDTVIDHENIDDVIHDLSENIPQASEIVTISTSLSDDIAEDAVYSDFSDSIKRLDSPNNPTPSGNRLPKSKEDFIYTQDNKFIKDISENTEKSIIPNGTYRVSYHVTGSVSSKQANKTQHLPAYELALEPDVVLEIPSNQTNTLTIDKLRQLASLATISDYKNSSLFRAPGGIISTKAIPSSYTLNQAGFKILTKSFNKVQHSKEDDNNIGKPEKTYGKPFVTKLQKENDVIKENNGMKHNQ